MAICFLDCLRFYKMCMVKVIPIRKQPKYIVVTQFDETCQYHYHLSDLTTVNKYCDVGVWKEKSEIPINQKTR